MKNIFKVLGIIALVAVIGFSMAACGGDDDSGGGSGSGGGGGGGGGSGQAPSGPSVNAALEGSGVVWTSDDAPVGGYVFIGGKIYAWATAGGNYYAGKTVVGTYTNTTVSYGGAEYTYSVSGNKLTWTRGGVSTTFTKKTVSLTWFEGE